MAGIVWVGPGGRKRLMEMYRRHSGPLIREEAHIGPTTPNLKMLQRIRWHRREHNLRNHRCRMMAEVPDLVLEWLECGRLFEV